MLAMCVLLNACAHQVSSAVALPGDLVFPEGPTSSPVPSMTTRNFLNPAFGWRGAIIVLAAVATMVVIALVARTVEHRRNRYSSQ